MRPRKDKTGEEEERPSQEAWELGLFKELFVLLLTAGGLHAMRHKASADYT